MNRMALLGVLLILVTTGCATTETVPSAQAGGSVFRGEVWTWDERAKVVTLRVGTEIVRVQVTPDEIRDLRLHQNVTLAPPATIEHVVAPSASDARGPQGPVQQFVATGTVSTIDPKGLVTLETAQGRHTVWAATPDASGFPAGTPGRLRVSVQPAQMVAITESAHSPTSIDPSDRADGARRPRRRHRARRRRRRNLHHRRVAARTDRGDGGEHRGLPTGLPVV